jgi:hypothetical protein
VYYLTFWYKTDERSIRVAFILASATLAGAFGGAIAYGVGHMNGTHGLEAWRVRIFYLTSSESSQCNHLTILYPEYFGMRNADFPIIQWLFIIEGIPSCLSSIFVYFFLPDYPETVKWLNPDEQALATRRLEFEASHGHDESLTWVQAKATLTDWRLYAHYAVRT